MYGVLANIIFVIHILIIVFMVGGALLPTKWKTKKIKIFHCYFSILVCFVQSIYGFRCPLIILEEHLRQLDNPNYVIKHTPFTEGLFMNLFGISISDDLVTCIILLLAIIGIAQLLTIKTTKKEDV